MDYRFLTLASTSGPLSRLFRLLDIPSHVWGKFRWCSQFGLLTDAVYPGIDISVEFTPNLPLSDFPQGSRSLFASTGTIIEESNQILLISLLKSVV
jgi:hypothetical protein